MIVASDIPVVCPVHRHALIPRLGEYVCPECTHGYAVTDGVLRILRHDDAFYEGAYESTIKFVPKSERPWHVWPLWLLNSGYVWAVRKHVPRGGVLVELGCAGGVAYFGQQYRAVACDLSFRSLRHASSYALRVQADASDCIPLPDASVDAIASSFFWEHIPPAVKPKIAEECMRVLKPGGKIVFLYDVETANPLIRGFRRREPELYRKLFLDGDGHVGYETPNRNKDVFLEAGFSVVEHRGLEKTWVQFGSVYAKLAQFSGTHNVLKLLSRVLCSRAFYAHALLMRILDESVGPLLPHSWARIDLLVAKKPA